MPNTTRPELKWVSFEKALLRLTKRELRSFARTHASKRFCSFAFDCNSKYGEIGLCLDTQEDLKAGRNAVDPNAAFWARVDQKVGLTVKPAATKQKTSRWDLGDWDYQAFNRKDFDRDWRRFQAIVTKRCMAEDEDKRTFMTPTQARFMQAVSNVLVQLERQRAFDVLNCTAMFSTLALDHDESEGVARARMRKTRNRKDAL